MPCMIFQFLNNVRNNDFKCMAFQTERLSQKVGTVSGLPGVL